MELGAIGELVGGVAVIATLIYLAIQVRHSARMAESALYDKTQESWPTILRPAIDEADLYVRGLKDFDELDESEALRFAMIVSRIFGYYENYYLKRERLGLLGREESERVDCHLAWNLARPGIGQGYWSNFQYLFTDSFVRHVDGIFERIKRGEFGDLGGVEIGPQLGREA